MPKEYEGFNGYWQQVLKEFNNKGIGQGQFVFTEIHRIDIEDGWFDSDPSPCQVTESYTAYSYPTRKKTRYYLYHDDYERYLTQSEASCAIELYNGKTAREAGQSLELSKRSVEYYIDNVKTRLNCANRRQLMQLLEQSDFFANYAAQNNLTFDYLF